MCEFCENNIKVELDNPYLDLMIVSSPKCRLFNGYNKCLAIGCNVRNNCSVEFVPIKYCPFCGKPL